MKQLTKILLAAGVLSFAATGFAAQPASFGPGMQGFYAGADAGVGVTSCSTCALSDTSTNGSSNSNTSFAATLFGGYQLNQYVAFEAGWGALPSVGYKVTVSQTPGSGNPNNTATATHFYGAVKGMYPLPKRFGLFGKVGYDYMSVSSTTLEALGYSGTTDSFDASGILLAAGASYAINPNLALTLAYNQILDSHSGTNLSVSYGTLGLTYLF